MQGRGKPRRRFVVFIVFAFPSLRRRRRGGGVFRHLRRPSKRFLQLAASSLLPDLNPNDQAALPSCVVGLAWCRPIKRRPFVCGSFDRMKNRIIYKIWVVFGRLTTHRGRTQDRFWRFFDEKKYSKIFGWCPSVVFKKFYLLSCPLWIFRRQQSKIVVLWEDFLLAFGLEKNLTRFFRLSTRVPKSHCLRTHYHRKSVAFFSGKKEKEIHP